MSTAEQHAAATLALLTEIRDELRLIRAGVKAPTIATDDDLDSQYGDEEVKFMPRNWTGDDFKGSKMSRTDAAFLEMLAKSFDYFAQKNDASGEKTDKGVPKSTYDKRSAARARGWAKRLRDGWKSPEPMTQDSNDSAFTAF